MQTNNAHQIAGRIQGEIDKDLKKHGQRLCDPKLLCFLICLGFSASLVAVVTWLVLWQEHVFYAGVDSSGTETPEQHQDAALIARLDETIDLLAFLACSSLAMIVCPILCWCCFLCSYCGYKSLGHCCPNTYQYLGPEESSSLKTRCYGGVYSVFCGPFSILYGLCDGIGAISKGYQHALNDFDDDNSTLGDDSSLINSNK